MIIPSYILSYKNRRLNPLKPVEIYRNLRNPTFQAFSVRQGGKVIGRTSIFALVDCKFIVGEAGRRRVLKTKQKNVHAFIRGFWLQDVNISSLKTEAVSIAYNPYKYGYFYNKETGEPIYKKRICCGYINNLIGK